MNEMKRMKSGFLLRYIHQLMALYNTVRGTAITVDHEWSEISWMPPVFSKQAGPRQWELRSIIEYRTKGLRDSDSIDSYRLFSELYITHDIKIFFTLMIWMTTFSLC